MRLFYQEVIGACKIILLNFLLSKEQFYYNDLFLFNTIVYFLLLKQFDYTVYVFYYLEVFLVVLTQGPSNTFSVNQGSSSL